MTDVKRRYGDGFDAQRIAAAIAKRERRAARNLANGNATFQAWLFKELDREFAKRLRKEGLMP